MPGFRVDDETTAPASQTFIHAGDTALRCDHFRAAAIIRRRKLQPRIIASQREPDVLGAGMFGGIGDELLRAADHCVGDAGRTNLESGWSIDVDRGARRLGGDRVQRVDEVDVRAHRVHRGADIIEEGCGERLRLADVRRGVLTLRRRRKLEMQR